MVLTRTLTAGIEPIVSASLRGRFSVSKNMEKNILTVSKYLKLVNETLAMIPSDQITIVGEIVDYRLSQGKWINFDLKTKTAKRETEVKPVPFILSCNFSNRCFGIEMVV